jgi:hypothetical protein
MAAWLISACCCLTLPCQNPDLGNMIKISHWGLYTRNNSLNASRLILPVRAGASR